MKDKHSARKRKLICPKCRCPPARSFDSGGVYRLLSFLFLSFRHCFRCPELHLAHVAGSISPIAAAAGVTAGARTHLVLTWPPASSMPITPSMSSSFVSVFAASPRNPLAKKRPCRSLSRQCVPPRPFPRRQECRLEPVPISC